MIKCHNCKQDSTATVASISTMAAGIEYIHCYVFCKPCDLFTRDTYKDNWSGDADIFIETMTREVAEEKIAQIAQCPTPNDKFCRCPIHEKIGVGW